MKVSMSLEMWMQCGPSHVKCGCNVDPPHLHILKVDVVWSNVDVLWSNVDFHISNVIKCRYIVGQHNGDLRLFLDKFEINVDRHTKKCGSTTSPHLDNVDPPHLHISTMWSFHTYTFDNLTYTLSPIKNGK